MARQVINVGTNANDGTGDGLRNAYIKCNENFAELYSRVNASVPSSSIGSAGDSVGDIAANATHLYVCFQDYDGSSIIWGRVSLDTSW